jgi:hypothetical protein
MGTAVAGQYMHSALLYTATDQGLLAVVFHAQRSFATGN